MTNPTFDAIPNVPRPANAQPPLAYELEQRGWWISDNTMRTLAEMCVIWFCDICSDECDGYSDEEQCPYGLAYAAACVISQRIKCAYDESEDSK